jgi:hypothetical protein
MTHIEQEQHRQTVLCVDGKAKAISIKSAPPQKHPRNPRSPCAETNDLNRSPPPGTAASPIVTISPYPLILSLTISDTNSNNLGPNPTKSSGRCHSTDGLVTGASGKSRCFEYNLPSGYRNTSQVQGVARVGSSMPHPCAHTTVSILNPSIPRSSQNRIASS